MYPKHIFRILLTIQIALLLSACTRGSAFKLDHVSSTKPAAKTNINTQPYRLGPGDKLQVTVEGIKEHSGRFDVNGNGSVTLPFVGNVHAAGLTLSEFKVQVTKALKNYVRNPEVRIAVLNFRPFYIQGEVKKGGQYDYREGLDVRRAVAIAGGYTYRAVKRYVYILHANHNKERKYSLNRQVLVQPGDNIRIPERFF